MIKLIISLLFGYLVGSLNFAIIYSKLRGDDIRRRGSKNAGATNILRIYGTGAAAIVFILDILKGFVAVELVKLGFGMEKYEYAAALGAVLGHNFPVYYGFRGGKGVATSFAVLLALHWETAIIALLVFIVVLMISRYVSLSSITASLAVIAVSYCIYGFNNFFVLCTIMGVLCILRHRKNIGRLLSGTEHKI